MNTRALLPFVGASACLLCASCGSPPKPIEQAYPAPAPRTPDAAPRSSAATVDAIPADDARRAFQQSAVARGADKPLPPVARPAPRSAQAAQVESPGAAEEVVQPVTVPAEPAREPETLPAPSIPARREAQAPSTPTPSESAMLRGAQPPAAPPSAPPPAELTPPATPPAAEPAQPAAQPTPPAAEPAPPAAPPAPPPTPPAAEPPAEPSPEPKHEPGEPLKLPVREPEAGAPQALPTPPAPQQPAQPAETPRPGSDAGLKPSPDAPAAEHPGDADAAMKLLHLAIATRVKSYGQVTALDPSQLPPGGRAIVYFELAGWKPVVRSDGMLVTEVHYTVQLLDNSGTPVWSDMLQKAKDVSRAARKDLYVTRLLTVPATIVPAKYSLRVVALDPATGDEASAVIPLEVKAPASK